MSAVAVGDRARRGRYSRGNATIVMSTPPGDIDRLFRILGDDSRESRRSLRRALIRTEMADNLQAGAGQPRGDVARRTPRISISCVSPNAWPDRPDASPNAWQALRSASFRGKPPESSHSRFHMRQRQTVPRSGVSLSSLRRRTRIKQQAHGGSARILFTIEPETARVRLRASKGAAPA